MSLRETVARAILVSLIVTTPFGARAEDRVSSLHAREAAFMRTVDKKDNAYIVTGDLVRYTGAHVAYTCAVDRIVQRGLILGQCGAEAEPLDLFVHIATGRLHTGERLRILGVLEPPAQWTDINGHTVYYAFMKAMFADPVS